MESLICRLAINRGRFALPPAHEPLSQSLLLTTPGLHLEAKGGQPARHYREQALIVVFNGHPALDGELQNARQIADHYRRQGTARLTQLCGHFRLLILDEAAQQILCFTDKFATHPVYYHSDPHQVTITDSLSALCAQRTTAAVISAQALYHYLYFHCIPSPLTIYQGIHKLPPAQQLTWHQGQVNTQLYWRPEFHSLPIDSPRRGQQQLRQRLEQALGRYADSPDTGAFLSGGLDSSSVAGYLARTSNRTIDTFTIGFSEPGYDESEFAGAVAKHFKTRHHVYQMTPKDLYQQLPRVASYFDEPFGNSSALPTFYCAQLAKSNGIHRLLAGDGGDELFAGNSRYAKQKIFEYYHHLPAAGRRLLQGTLPSLARRVPLTLFKKAASYIEQAQIKLPHRLQHYNFLHQYPVHQVLTQRLRHQLDLQLPATQLQQRYTEISPASAIDNMLYLDWKFTLADNDLVKVNNMTAMAGVDVAYPMLDEGVLALSTTIPASLKLPGQELRAFYKQAMASFLPSSTLHKSKHGFGLPFGKWLQKDPQLSALVRESLQRLKQRDIIEPAFIDLALQMQQQIHASFFGELVWLMMTLELWLAAQPHSGSLSPEKQAAIIV